MLSELDPGALEVRLEAAFDRYNRAVIAGMEPTPVLFIEALEAEGLRLSLSASEAVDTESLLRPETKEPAQRGSIRIERPVGSPVTRRVRGLF